MNATVIISFAVYFLIVLGVGIYFFFKSKSVSDYFLGGRQLNSWVTAISAQASDMSGWLLMGLPAAVFISGLTQSWIAIGLFVGTYLNWLIVAKRLRKFTAATGDAITIPEYLQNRFKTKSISVRMISAIIIFVFFLIYTASAFNAGAKLFQNVFKIDYVTALTIGALIIVVYTFLGGFMAVCWTDLFQGILMFCALVVVPIACIIETPDFSFSLLQNIPDRANFLSFVKDASGAISVKEIISGLAWGLGYFGMPHILVRFMAIKSSSMIKKSRIIACIWVFITLTAAVMVGLFGYTYLSQNGMALYETKAAAETIFMDLSADLMPPVIAGVLLSAILAAIMSTADSQLLVTASAVTNDFYKVFAKKEASSKKLMWISRITVIVIAIVAYIIAFNPENTVMGLVSYAWSGFGSAFGPVIILSLFWKRMTLKGTIAGMIAGGVSVVIWETFLNFTGIYSLLPCFVFAFVVIVVVSLIDKAPSQDVIDTFNIASSKEIEKN